jgi:hypothetical protein
VTEPADTLIGRSLHLRIYVPSEGTLATVVGVIAQRLRRPPDQRFHDAVLVSLDAPLSICGTNVDVLHVVPSGSYPYVAGQDKLLDLLHGPVHIAISWRSESGEWTSSGERAHSLRCARPNKRMQLSSHRVLRRTW